MSNVTAWIMNINEKLFVSVSQMELVHIINDPVYSNIPWAPGYCHDVIVWNDNILPVVDLSGLDDHHKVNTIRGIVAVIVYRDDRGEIHYGGIFMSKSPDLEPVDNSQVCRLPAHAECLQEVTLSCFTSKKGHQVPILDIGRLFSSNYAESYSSR